MVGGGHVPQPGEISIELRTQAEHIGTLKVHQIAAARFHHRVLPQTFIVPVEVGRVVVDERREPVFPVKAAVRHPDARRFNEPPAGGRPVPNPPRPLSEPGDEG